MLDFISLRPIQAMAASIFFQKRRLMLVLPRQFGGKTELGVRLTADLLMSHNPKQCLFLAKDKKSAKRAVREKHMRIFDKNLFNVNTENVSLKSNPSACCFIESVDKDPDRIRGGTFGLVHWSEVAFSKIEHGNTVRDVFDKVVAPTLAIADGFALLETTNNGGNAWRDMWDNHKEMGFARLLVSLEMMVEFGLVPRETYDKIKATTQPDIFRQEYNCEFVTFAGKIYTEFDPNKHITADIPWPEDWQRVVAGIDWGYNDGTSFIFSYVKDGKIYIFDEIFEQQRTLEDIITIFNQHKGPLWNCGSFAAVADHNPARNEELNRRGIPCGPATKADTLGNRLQIKEKFFKNEIFIHPRCKHLIRDLTTACWDTKKLNEIDYSQATVGHFDNEAAFRYLIRELSEFEADEPIVNPHAGLDDISAAAWQMNRQRKAAILTGGEIS